MTVTSRPSIRQVAELAGVSRMTVSRVLNNQSDRFSEATRERVLQAVRELEYAPVAQPMMQSRNAETRVLGLVFDGTPTEGSWGLPTFWGLSEAAQKNNYDLLTMWRVCPEWMGEQEELRFLDRRCDGFIFIAPVNRRPLLEKLVKHQLPIVACYTSDVPPEVPKVVLDNAGAMRMAVNHLLTHGHRRIMHVTSTSDRSDFTERWRGYEAAMRLAGLEPHVVQLETLDDRSSTEDLLQTIRTHHVEAIACASDNYADFVWNVAEANGLRVPEDLSLVGMGDLSAPARRGLTSIHFSCEEVGRRAAEVAIQLLAGGEQPANESVVPVQLIEGVSVAK